MKKRLVLASIALLSAVFFLSSCTAATTTPQPSATSVMQSQQPSGKPSEVTQTEQPSAIASATMQADGSKSDPTTTVSLNKSLIKKPWEIQDIKGLEGYFMYYTNQEQPGASILMGRVDHRKDKGEDLQEELKLTTETYLNETLKGSMAEANSTPPEYFEIDGYPAVSFNVTGKLQQESAPYTARTVFLATPKGIYSLQMQNDADTFADTESFFNELIESLAVTTH